MKTQTTKQLEHLMRSAMADGWSPAEQLAKPNQEWAWEWADQVGARNDAKMADEAVRIAGQLATEGAQ